jgi:putative ABC transport system permease protein
MGQLGTDIRYAFRAMRRSPGFTLVAVITLALGLGANAAIFSFVDGVLLKPIEFPEPERLVQLWEKPPTGGPRNGISAANLLDWQAQNQVFESISAISGKPMTMTGSGEPQQIRTQTVSASYFDILKFKPALGRTFARGEDEPGKDNVVVLSHKIWQNRFGGDPAIVGRTLVFDGMPHTVIGVLPEGSSFDRQFNEVWVPLSFKPEQRTRNFHWMGAIGRLKPGVTMEQARANMEAIAANIARTYPDIKKDWSVTLDPYLERIVNPQMRQSLQVLMYTVAGVLLICCVNLANLLLARGSARSRELAIRTAVGASRHQIIRQILTESVILSGLGAVVGVVFGYGLFYAIHRLSPPFLLPPHANVQMDWRVLLFLTVIALAAGILFGLAPAWQLTRRDAGEALKEGGRGSAGSLRRGRLRSALVITEVALAFILLVGAGLMIRSFQKLLTIEMGFDSTNVITMGMPLSLEQNTDGPRLAAYVSQVVEQVGSLPGVRNAAITSALPMQGWGFGMPFRIGGHSQVDASKRPACFFKMVTPGYFPALRMKLRKGRGLAVSDVQGSMPVAVISETMVQRYFPNEEPLGKQIIVEQVITGKRELGPEIPWTVVGVVADERVNNLDSDSSPGMYVPYAQGPVVGFALLVRAEGDPAQMTKSIQNRVWQINKNQALTSVRTLDQIKSEITGGSRLRTTLLGIFAGLALALAAVGIYGVLSYTTAQRTQELGVRAALGARPRDLVGLVLSGGMILTGIGLVLGVAGALALTRLLKTLLFRMEPYDPLTLASVTLVLGGVALIACLVPALRATRVDPVTALRFE